MSPFARRDPKAKVLKAIIDDFKSDIQWQKPNVLFSINAQRQLRFTSAFDPGAPYNHVSGITYHVSRITYHVDHDIYVVWRQCFFLLDPQKHLEYFQGSAYCFNCDLLPLPQTVVFDHLNRLKAYFKSFRLSKYSLQICHSPTNQSEAPL